jgi:chromate reductase
MVGNALVELAPPSLVLERVEIGDLPLYNQDLDAEHRPANEWLAFRDQVRGKDGVLFVTPEYNRSVPGGLKNAIDVGSRPYGHSVWAGKPAAIVSNSPGMYGGFGANHHLRQSLVFLDMPAMQQPEAYLSHVDKSFDDAGKLTSDRTRESLTKFLTAFASWVEIHAAHANQPARKSA